MKNLDVAKKFAHKIDSEHMDIVESYTFNRSVIEWLKGNYTLHDVTSKSTSSHTIQFIGYSNSPDNLDKEVKVIKTLNDSKYVLFFQRMFKRVSKNYLYGDHNSKEKFMVSSDTSNIFELFSNFNEDLIISVTITEGFKLYSSKSLSLRQFYEVENVTCAAANRKLSKIIYGDKKGRVVFCLLNLQKRQPMDVGANKWLFTHDGYTKMVAISPGGNKACSFGYLDRVFVVYDLKGLNIASKTKLDLVISSYCFDFNANKSLMSFESTNELTVWDHSAPVHRRKSICKAHNDFIYIVRIADDGAMGLSCDLSMHMILWNLTTNTAMRDVKINGYVMNISPTPFFKLIIIKTTSSVQIYEPKLKLFWQQFKCDAFHKGLCCIVNTLSYDYIKDVDLLKIETISAINKHKPLKKTEVLDKLCKESGG